MALAYIEETPEEVAGRANRPPASGCDTARNTDGHDAAPAQTTVNQKEKNYCPTVSTRKKTENAHDTRSFPAESTAKKRPKIFAFQGPSAETWTLVGIGSLTLTPNSERS